MLQASALSFIDADEGQEQMRFDHLGIVVADIAEGRDILNAMFDIQRWTEVYEDPGIGVYVQFGIGSDGPCYELIAPFGEGSPISVALKTGKGIDRKSVV